MEDDPHILKPNHTQKTPLEYLSLFTDYISIPICALAIFADVLIIIVILRHKRLKTRSNYFILNFAAFHILYILSTPCFYIILDLFYNSQLTVHWYCVWIKLENLGIALALTFAVGYSADNFLESKSPSWWSKYEQRYLYAFSFLYFFHFLIYLISSSICLRQGMANNFNLYFLTVYYCALLAIVCYIHFKTTHRYFTSQLSLMVLLIWLPLYLWYNLINIYEDDRFVEFMLWYTAFLPEYLAYCCSVAVVWKLWKSNKHYKVAFRKFFRVPVSSLDYEALNVSETRS